jgi:hypothetical protein
MKKPVISAKRLEALQRMRYGEHMISDKYNLRYVDGWRVVEWYWLVSNGYIRVFDKTKSSTIRTNGHVITEKGLTLLKTIDAWKASRSSDLDD